MNSEQIESGATKTGHQVSLSSPPHPPLPPPPSLPSSSATKSTTTTTTSSEATKTTLPHSKFNMNLADTLVDESGFVDLQRQHDCSSNQSGSDSGLGHTNSVSSDNSTFTAIVQDHHSLGNSISRSSSNKQINTNPASSCTTTSKLSSINESRINPEDALTKQSSFTIAHNSKETKKLDELLVRPKDYRDELVVPNTQTQAQQRLPVIKSLLKKSSSTIQKDSLTSKPHKRNVSFNQTVIVFCEEIEAPSPSDHFEPPLDYQDPSSTLDNFEPPKDYCDYETVDCRQKQETNGCTVGPPDAVQGGGADGDGIAKVLNADGTSNLTDDQILGLLEDESLLESFRLNCEDFSDDEFPVNYLNSNHSYLCDDAISDYDPDSESSLCIDRKAIRLTSAPVKNTADNERKNNSIDHDKTSNHEPILTPLISIASSVSKNKTSNEVKNLSEQSISVRSTRAQKTMPARMKVSTLDNSHLKRSSQQDNDLKNKVELNHKSDFAAKKPLNKLEADPPVLQHNNQSSIELITPSERNLVAASKPAQEQILSTKTNDNLLISSSIDKSGPPKLVNQLYDYSTGSIDAIPPHKEQELYVNQTGNTNLNQVQASHACHICRVIESDRSQANSKCMNLTDQLDSSRHLNNKGNDQHETYIGLNQIRAGHETVTNQAPDAFKQSCTSCNEAATKQQYNVAAQLGSAQLRTANSEHQPRPVACQLVYVVDQKGNRVRALSVVRPPMQNVIRNGPQVLTGRRIFIAQNGIRFASPFSDAHHANFATNQVNSPPRLSAPALNNGSNIHQYRILEPHQFTQLHRGHLVANESGVARVQAPLNPYMGPIEGSGMRPHTVYYVRQPLDTHNIRQSCESNSPRSFPDPHEIRRMDGLRGPTSVVHSGQTNNQGTPLFESTTPSQVNLVSSAGSQAIRKVSDVMKGEMDDPTFGFSKRPSVKVVATNNPSNSVNQALKPSNSGHESTRSQFPPYASLSNVRRTHIVGQSGNIEPISLVVLGSQTLDRRNSNQQNFHQSKDGLPSTSSMSNIHGTYTSIKPTQGSNISSHQSSIFSANQTVNYVSPDNPKFKGVIKRA